jgi:membrane associated rhomboid family serine protease
MNQKTKTTHKIQKPRVISLSKLDSNIEHEIESETKFLWKLIKSLLLLPIVLLQILFGKKHPKHVFEPIKIIFNFIFAAKLTISLIIINFIGFISQYFMSEQLLISLISYPSDILTFRYYTLFTSGFLHADIWHLLGNMLGIFIFGRIIERKLGTKKTFGIYFGALLISGIISSLVNWFVFSNNIPGLGASGAVMGLISAAILLDPFYITHDMLFPLPAMIIGWAYIFWDLQSVWIGANDGIGHFAHIGGFLSISLIYFFMKQHDKKRLKKGFLINIISAIFLAAIYLFFFMKY